MGNKLFFWANYYIEQPDIGTTLKIKSEIDTFRAYGYEVYYTAYQKTGVAIYNNHDEVIMYQRYGIKGALLGGKLRKDSLITITLRFLKIQSFDLCMLRINCLTLSYMQMLKKMKKQHAFVAMQSLSYFPNMKRNDMKTLSHFLIAFSLKIHSTKLSKYVDLMLTEGAINDFYGIPCIEYGMGVDVDRYEPHNYSGNKDEINMIMVGCDSPYHGTDRIIASLDDYYSHCSNNQTVINLHLVGKLNDRETERIKKAKCKSHIICYGRKSGIELNEVFNKCNMALGPLAQYRIRKKDTGLKTKEYFARGIPYIYTGEEPHIASDYPFILQVPNDSSLIDMSTISDFYNSYVGNASVVSNMREIARQCFSWRSIIEKTMNAANEIKRTKQMLCVVN